MATNAEDGILVEIRRRTPQEQQEWMLYQLATLSAVVIRLEREHEAVIAAIQSLENRMAAVERATPLQKPKKAPPKKPWARGI
jgi:hypothetical protein